MTRLRGDALRALSALAVPLVFLAVVVLTPLRHYLSKTSVQEFVAATGWWGRGVLLALCVVTPLVMLPRWPFAWVGGFLYGVVEGSILANVGSAGGAVVGFLFARHLARSFVLRRLGERRQAALDRLTERHGVWILIGLRALPFSSFVVTNYLAGVSRMRLLPYVVASFLGMIPSTVLYALAGQAAKQPEQWLLILVGGLFVLFAAIMVPLGARFRRRLASSAETAATEAPSGPDAP